MWLATFCQLKSIWYSVRNSLAYPLPRTRRGRGSYHRVLVHCCPNTPPLIDGPDWHLDLLLGNPAGPRPIVSTCLTALLKHRHIGYPWGLWGKSRARNTSPIECLMRPFLSPSGHCVSNISDFDICLPASSSHCRVQTCGEEARREGLHCSEPPSAEHTGWPSITANPWASQEVTGSIQRNVFKRICSFPHVN